jgi:hypothetical protein
LYFTDTQRLNSHWKLTHGQNNPGLDHFTLENTEIFSWPIAC